MEVHHHAHSGGHKKNLKQYFTEFLMLFLAVTLGFFAENLREHQVEREREIKFLKIIHLDLKNDILSIDRVIKFNNEKRQMADTLFRMFKDRDYHNKLADFYLYAKTMGLRSLFGHSENGFMQLKNAGGLRMIQNQEIITAIQNYENYVNVVEKLQEIEDLTLNNYRFKGSQILDVSISDEMNKKQNMYFDPANGNSVLHRFKRPEGKLSLMNSDPAAINEFLNLLSYALNTNNYINNNLNYLKKQALALDALLVKEYGSSFETD